MLVEIPDPEVISSIIIAFFAGLFGLYVFTKISKLIKKDGVGSIHFERLEYFEKQLIDMKIHLDSLDILEKEPFFNKKPVQGQLGDLHEVDKNKQVNNSVLERPTRNQRTPNRSSNDMISLILEQITQRPMTSRDIQITLGRTREHTARLLKKIYQEGFVNRDVKTKPYQYFITEKGKARLNVLEPTSTSAA